jgi:hypothetical protein
MRDVLPHRRRIVNDMRAVLVLGCAVALLAPGAEASSATALTITYIEDSGRPTERVRWTLRCDPVGGSHPRRAAVCRELGRLGWRAFRPTPRDTVCAEIYGGPQVAIVSGRVDGRWVWVRLSRIDGCEIERWGRVRGLLPPGGAT